MLKSNGRIARKKATTTTFNSFHSSWISTLNHSLLPLLRHSLSSTCHDLVVIPTNPRGGGGMVASSDLLSCHVTALHSHFQAFYHALDLASRHDVTQLPLIRSPVETPFLWFADFHPSLFTNLVRSLNPNSQTLVSKIEQIERGIRLIVPSISQRFRDFQIRLVEKLGKGEEFGLREEVEELESIFGDANRLRRSILGEIVGAADVYQAALFLEALAEFVVGFWDEGLLGEFEHCKG